MKVLLLLFMLHGALAAVFTQPPSLRGVVRDGKSGERLPNATLLIRGTRVGVQSNIEGYFILTAVPDTPFVLEARFVGYSVKEIAIDPKKLPQDIAVELIPQDIEVEGVTSTAEEPKILKQETEPSHSTISPRQLATLPNAGQPDIFRSMQLLPGISATNDRSSGLYVRGGTPDENLVLFDGMTVYHVDHFFGFFSAFNPDAVKDVQFYKGGFPAMYGGRLSSVIDMTGKTGDPNNFHFGGGISLLSANTILEVPLFDHGSLLIAGRRSYSDILPTSAYTSLYNFLTGSSTTTGPQGFGGGRGGRRFSAISTQDTPTPIFDDLDSKLTYNISPDDIVSASFYSSMDDLDKSQQGSQQTVTNSNFQFTLPSTIDDTKQGNLGGSVNWFRQWNGRLYSNILVSRAKYTSTYVYGVDLTNPNTNSSTSQATNEDNSIIDDTFRLDNQWMADDAHQVSFGGQYSRTDAAYSLSATTVFRQSLSNLLTTNQQSNQTAAYVQDKWKPIVPFEVTYGLRATTYSLTSQFFLEPRFSARYALTDDFSLKGAYGIYHQFANRIINEDLSQGSRDFWILADDALPPGRAFHYILGGSWENEDFLFDLEGYYKDLNNIVEFSQRFRRTADDLYSFYLGSGTAKGIEVLIQKKLGWLNGWLSYTLGRAESIFPELNSGNPFPAEQDQTHELKVVGSATFASNWNISSTVIYGSGTPYTSPISQYTITLLDSSQFQYTHVSAKDAYRLPYYQRVDVSVSKRFGEENETHWILGFTAYNLLNHTNIAYYEYNLTSNPIQITQVTGLGFTPTLFAQFEFQ